MTTTPIFRMAPAERLAYCRQYVDQVVTVEYSSNRDLNDRQVAIGELVSVAAVLSGTTQQVLVLRQRRRDRTFHDLALPLSIVCGIDSPYASQHVHGHHAACGRDCPEVL